MNYSTMSYNSSFGEFANGGIDEDQPRPSLIGLLGPENAVRPPRVYSAPQRLSAASCGLSWFPVPAVRTLSDSQYMIARPGATGSTGNSHGAILAKPPHRHARLAAGAGAGGGSAPGACGRARVCCR